MLDLSTNKVEQSLKNGNYNNIDIDKTFLENINKFATVKHIVKKNKFNRIRYPKSIFKPC